VKLKEREEKIRLDLKRAEKNGASKKSKLLAAVTARDILNQIARITKTAPTELILEDASSLTHLEQKLAAAVVGQTEAVKTVALQVR
jgi:ATP-dependent Clp protease ATP-binding subunit ClpA